jgi:glutamate-1-semialdehyde 2,1-aminomutase
VAAGIATLRGLRETAGAYERLETLGARAEKGLREAAAAARVPACVNRVGSMFTLFIGPEVVRDHGEATRADTARFGRYFLGMLAEGVYLPPSQFEALFVSLAHTEGDVDRLVRAARKVLAEV